MLMEQPVTAACDCGFTSRREIQVPGLPCWDLAWLISYLSGTWLEIRAFKPENADAMLHIISRDVSNSTNTRVRYAFLASPVRVRSLMPPPRKLYNGEDNLKGQNEQ